MIDRTAGSYERKLTLPLDVFFSRAHPIALVSASLIVACSSHTPLGIPLGLLIGGSFSFSSHSVLTSHSSVARLARATLDPSAASNSITDVEGVRCTERYR